MLSHVVVLSSSHCYSRYTQTNSNWVQTSLDKWDLMKQFAFKNKYKKNKKLNILQFCQIFSKTSPRDLELKSSDFGNVFFVTQILII